MVAGVAYFQLIKRGLRLRYRDFTRPFQWSWAGKGREAYNSGRPALPCGAR